MIALVGYTGFVGSNIYASGKEKITHVYNSKNIEEAYGTQPELLIYAGLRAEKYLANHMPEKDLELILQAQENIRKIAPKKLVLISTIDVFKHPVNVDESADIDCENLHAYGLNRYRLECWVRQQYPDALIIRLPGLFGKNLKKNFIFDYINVIPFMLKAEKFRELAQKEPSIAEFYGLQPNGFYQCKALEEDQKQALRETFRKLGFTALNFTDSRSVYQFYPLARLWEDIQTALAGNLTLWHPATQPVSAQELYAYLAGEPFENTLSGAPANYDYRTAYAEMFGGKDGYICTKEEICQLIADFVSGCRAR